MAEKGVVGNGKFWDDGVSVHFITEEVTALMITKRRSRASADFARITRQRAEHEAIEQIRAALSRLDKQVGSFTPTRRKQKAA